MKNDWVLDLTTFEFPTCVIFVDIKYHFDILSYYDSSLHFYVSMLD
jgi:hypothetical protein